MITDDNMEVSSNASNTHIHLDHNAMPIVVMALMGMLLVFSVVGTLGNLLVLMVCNGKRHKTPTNIFIIALAVTDIFTCSVIIPLTMILEYLELNIHSDILCKLYMFLITCNVPFSASVIAAIALDRYLRICYLRRRSLSLTWTKLAVVMLAILPTIFGVFSALNYGTYALKTQHNVQNKYTDSNIYEALLSNSSEAFNHVLHLMDYHNVSVDVILRPHFTNETILVNTGVCQANYLILGEVFSYAYRTVYSFFFVIVIVFVTIMYIFIFKFVIIKRATVLRMRRKCSRKSKTGTNGEPEISKARLLYKNDHNKLDFELTLSAPVSTNQSTTETTPSPSNTPDVTKFSTIIQESERNISKQSTLSKNVQLIRFHENNSSTKQNHVKKDSTSSLTIADTIFRCGLSENNVVANIRTASSLFVVTLVFVVAFLPAWLMAHRLVGYNMIIFYMHFLYNVANPFIYSFLNYEFRRSLRRMFAKLRSKEFVMK